MLAQPRIPLLPLHTKELYWPPREWTHSQLAAVFAFISPTTSTTTSWGFPLQSRKDQIYITTTDEEHINRVSIQPFVRRSKLLQPGEVTIIEFTPDRVGEFKIRNIGHGFEGTIIVED